MLKKKIRLPNIVIAILLNAFFFVLAIVLCDPKYEVSDDFIIASVLSGAFGDNFNPMCMYINPILVYIFLPFYKMFPCISWYFVAQLVLSLVSFIGITYMLLENLHKRYAYLLAILFITFFSDDAYILVQFTKTAMIVGMSGAIIFLWSLFYKKSKCWIIIGGFLCLIGSMIRFSVIYIMGGFIIGILFWSLKEEWMKQKSIVNISKSKILPGLILIGVVFGCQYMYINIYSNDQEYYSFFQYNSARASVVDRSDYGYEAYKEELEDLGVSENDYLAMRTWNFADPDYFSANRLEDVGKVIANYKDNLKIDWNDVFVKIQDRGLQTYTVFKACILLIVIAVFFQKGFLKYVGYFMFVACIYEIYLFLRERVVYRVEYGIFFCAFVSLLYFWNQKKMRNLGDNIEIRNICVIMLGMLLMLKLFFYIPDFSYKKVDSNNRKEYVESVFWASDKFDIRKYKKVVNKDVPANELLEEMASNKNNFYFLDFQTTIQTLFYEWSPFSNLPIGYFDNFAYFGGVTTNFPDVNNNLEEHGVENPMLSLLEDNVYLIDNSTLMIKLNYIREHFYPNAKAELCKEVAGYQIWKFYKE